MRIVCVCVLCALCGDLTEVQDLLEKQTLLLNETKNKKLSNYFFRFSLTLSCILHHFSLLKGISKYDV